MVGGGRDRGGGRRGGRDCRGSLGRGGARASGRRGRVGVVLVEVMLQQLRMREGFHADRAEETLKGRRHQDREQPSRSRVKSGGGPFRIGRFGEEQECAPEI